MASVLGILPMFRPLDRRAMLAWHLLGPAIILLPTFGASPFFMNLLAAWKLWAARRPNARADATRTGRPDAA